MQLYALPTGAFINLLEITEIKPLPGGVSEESNSIHSPRCVIALHNGSVHVIETESFDAAKALAGEIANNLSRQARLQAPHNLSLRDEP